VGDNRVYKHTNPTAAGLCEPSPKQPLCKRRSRVRASATGQPDPRDPPFPSAAFSIWRQSPQQHTVSNVLLKPRSFEDFICFPVSPLQKLRVLQILVCLSRACLAKTSLFLSITFTNPIFSFSPGYPCSPPGHILPEAQCPEQDLLLSNTDWKRLAP